jgi:hypothetical protein
MSVEGLNKRINRVKRSVQRTGKERQDRTGKKRVVRLKDGEECKPKEEQNGRGNKKVKLRIK